VSGRTLPPNNKDNGAEESFVRKIPLHDYISIIYWSCPERPNPPSLFNSILFVVEKEAGVGGLGLRLVVLSGLTLQTFKNFRAPKVTMILEKEVGLGGLDRPVGKAGLIITYYSSFCMNLSRLPDGSEYRNAFPQTVSAHLV